MEKAVQEQLSESMDIDSDNEEVTATRNEWKDGRCLQGVREESGKQPNDVIYAWLLAKLSACDQGVSKITHCPD